MTLEVENLTFNIRRTGDAAGRGMDRLGNSLRRVNRAAGSANKGLEAKIGRASCRERV